MTGINSRTVQKFLKRVRERGNVENLPRSGSRRKTTPRDDRILYRSIKSNRRQTLKDVTSRFNARTGYSVSTRTVSRRLFEDGYRRCVVSKKTTISRVNREKRTRFCRQKLHWTVDNQCSSIIFSDKTKIEFDIYVWRRLRSECLGVHSD